MKFSESFFILAALLITTLTPVSSQISGSFLVRNSGAYVAKFRINFQVNGQWQTYYSGDFLAGQSRSLDLPMGTGYCEIHVENLVFLGIWKGVFSLGFENPVTKCYKIWGTTLHPGWGEEQC